MEDTWFLFDLGNTVIKLAYERVLAAICADASMSRDELVELLEEPGAYRDMERGAVSFYEFYEFLCDHAGYRGSIRDFHQVWSDFFDGTMPGIEDLLDRIRERYRIAFLSNSNEIHAELIPTQFAAIFHKDEPFVFSHRLKAAKPDPDIFKLALELIGSTPQNTIFVDDLIENVVAARAIGMQAFQFTDTRSLSNELEREGLL
ncbi:MAG: HAD family phosphatase [Acidobacteria bacterium]|nr:HAD family phosphatase [Acidobacteriota bacterium]MBV9070467.1 HAD family phosphatase [Acidobacteriota bacterium]MBV9186193.1 HAD family phosphatase [Acidobacteriota bacterium]